MMTWAPCPHGVRTRGKKNNANDLGRHKLSRTSLNEATLQSQERSKCDVSSEWSQVPVLALEKEDFQAYMASKMHRHQVEP